MCAYRDHVVYVTESEASVHFGVLYSTNQQSEWLKVRRAAHPDFPGLLIEHISHSPCLQPRSTFAVVDGGGARLLNLAPGLTADLTRLPAGSTVDICIC